MYCSDRKTTYFYIRIILTIIIYKCQTDFL